MSESDDREAQIRGFYRLGQLDQEEGFYDESLEFFKRVRIIDPKFCSDIVNLRIAEVHYKLD